MKSGLLVLFILCGNAYALTQDWPYSGIGRENIEQSWKMMILSMLVKGEAMVMHYISDGKDLILFPHI